MGRGEGLFPHRYAEGPRILFRSAGSRRKLRRAAACNACTCWPISKGHPLQHSEIYDSIGLDTPDEIKSILKSGQPATRIRKDSQGVPYMIRSGLLVDHAGHKYYWRSAGPSIRTTRSLAISPGTISAWCRWSSCSAACWDGSWRAGLWTRSIPSPKPRSASRTPISTCRFPLRQTGDELDRLIEAFNHMMTRLNFSFEQIRQFSTDVSHELRTPLTVVRGQLEVALFTAQTVEQYREAMVERARRRGPVVEHRAGAADALASRIRPVGVAEDATGFRRPCCATRWISTRFRPKPRAWN